MGYGISDQDKERMRQFTTTPSYERTPDMLVPEEEEDDDVTDVRENGRS